MTSNDLQEIGPIDYLVVEFPGSNMTGEGLPPGVRQLGPVRILVQLVQTFLSLISAYKPAEPDAPCISPIRSFRR